MQTPVLDTLEGVVERITFHAEDTGYTVAKLRPSRGGKGLITVVGTLAQVTPGESMRLEGEWSTHPQYGRQFKIQRYRSVYPSTLEGIRKYLGSGLIKGIGPVTAGRIVKYFELDTLHVIEEEPSRLVEVEGLGPKRAAMIQRAWEEQRVLEYIMAHSPLLRAYRVVTTEYTPKESTWDRVLEYTSVYGRAGAGGTDFISGEDDPFVLQAGVQINIPIASTKERREQALKAVEETRAIDEIRGKALADIARLRQHEADLAASEQRLEFYEDKSGWLQKRQKKGYEDLSVLWDIGQKLNEERAAAERLRVLVASQRYQVANYAGERWEELLGYLEGKAELDEGGSP